MDPGPDHGSSEPAASESILLGRPGALVSDSGPLSSRRAGPLTIVRIRVRPLRARAGQHVAGTVLLNAAPARVSESESESDVRPGTGSVAGPGVAGHLVATAYRDDRALPGPSFAGRPAAHGLVRTSACMGWEWPRHSAKVPARKIGNRILVRPKTYEKPAPLGRTKID